MHARGGSDIQEDFKSHLLINIFPLCRATSKGVNKLQTRSERVLMDRRKKKQDDSKPEEEASSSDHNPLSRS